MGVPARGGRTVPRHTVPCRDALRDTVGNSGGALTGSDRCLLIIGDVANPIFGYAKPAVRGVWVSASLYSGGMPQVGRRLPTLGVGAGLLSPETEGALGFRGKLAK
jgi:hypothetical protein